MSMVGTLVAAPESSIARVDFDVPELGGDALYFDELWAATGFLLTGENIEEAKPRVEPLFFLTTPYGEDGAEGSYGPAIIYSPLEVERIAQAVAALPDDTVRQRVESPELGDEYPFSVGGSVSSEDRKELIELVAELRAFLKAAALRGDGLVFWVE